MREYIGKVSDIIEGEEKAAVSFHLETDEGERVLVIVKGDLPSVVKSGAHVIVCGEYSATMGGIILRRFIAKRVESYEHPENKQYAVSDWLKVRYSFEDWEKELRNLHAEQLSSFYLSALEQEKPFVVCLIFLMAAMDRFSSLATSVLYSQMKAVRFVATMQSLLQTWLDMFIEMTNKSFKNSKRRTALPK